MTSKIKSPKKAEQLKAELKKLQSTISDQVQQLHESDAWKEFLTYAQAFHRYLTRRECSVLQGGGESPGLRWGGPGSRCTASTRRWVPRRPIQRSRSQTRAASHASSAAPVRGTPGACTGWTPLSGC